jgi:hypothetical protein
LLVFCFNFTFFLQRIGFWKKNDFLDETERR